MPKQMHLTGFMLFAPAPHMIMSWVYPKEKITYQWYETEYWESIAKTLERGKFDMFFFADGWAGGTNAAAVRYAIQFPNHDPVSLVSYLSAVTKKLGFAVTMSTTFYNPFMLTRKLATLDHLTKGRIGWNIVSSISTAEARNFGMDDLPPHDERYDRADEYMQVCYRLWDSWEDDAMQYLLEEGGGDGFQITPSYYAPDYYEDLVSLLIPVLQQRGVFRTHYTGKTLREYMTL